LGAGAVACGAIVLAFSSNRSFARRFSFPQRPIWAEFLIGSIGCVLSLGAVIIVIRYYWPPRIAATYARNTTSPCRRKAFIPSVLHSDADRDRRSASS